MHALDYAQSAVATTKQKGGDAQVSTNVTVGQHDARDPLPYPEGSFDCCYSHMLFSTPLREAELRLLSRETLRVLRPGGLCIYPRARPAIPTTARASTTARACTSSAASSSTSSPPRRSRCSPPNTRVSRSPSLRRERCPAGSTASLSGSRRSSDQPATSRHSPAFLTRRHLTSSAWVLPFSGWRATLHRPFRRCRRRRSQERRQSRPARAADLQQHPLGGRNHDRPQREAATLRRRRAARRCSRTAGLKIGSNGRADVGVDFVRAHRRPKRSRSRGCPFGRDREPVACGRVFQRACSLRAFC